jgi:hypothetical protein
MYVLHAPLYAVAKYSPLPATVNNAFAGMLDQITGGDSAICSQLTNEVEHDVECQYANDGECDEPDLCAEVSDASIRN